MPETFSALLFAAFGAFSLSACGGDASRPTNGNATDAVLPTATDGNAATTPTPASVAQNAVSGTVAGQSLTPNSIVYGINDSNELTVVISTNPQECNAIATYIHRVGDVTLTIQSSGFPGDGNYPVSALPVDAASGNVRLAQKADIAPGTRASLAIFISPNDANGIAAADAGSLQVTRDNSAQQGNLDGGFSFDFASNGNMSGTFQAVWCAALSR